MRPEGVPKVLKLSCKVNECKPLVSDKGKGIYKPGASAGDTDGAATAGAYTRPLFGST